MASKIRARRATRCSVRPSRIICSNGSRSSGVNSITLGGRRLIFSYLTWDKSQYEELYPIVIGTTMSKNFSNSPLGDLYYIYQHEMIGVFRVSLKLQELFKAGVVRLSSGPGAFALYQYDRRQVLRYTQLERQQAYLRAFGYTCAQPAPGSLPNRIFHSSFSHFIAQVARFFRDKRISEVIRERATDPSFGSIAIVRRAGLDLRYNLKQFSYGHLNVMRVEVLQLLEEAFKILNSDDIKRLFGAENAWEVIEDVLRRYFKEYINASQRNRMAINGREVLRWLAEPHILKQTRAEFETLLLQIAEPAEEWLSSAQALGVGARIQNGARPVVSVPREAVIS